MFSWADDLFLRKIPLFLDSRTPRDRCFISHAHADHLPHGGPHQSAICTSDTAAIALHRGAMGKAELLEFRDPQDLDQDTRIELRSAGHVLGSAMLHVTRPDETFLYTGDFKLRQSLTVEVADPLPADVLVMESTYGLPEFRFPPAQLVGEQVVERTRAAMAHGRQPIVMGYSLGKAQEVVRILRDAGIMVTCHGAVFAINEIYERLGVRLGECRRYRAEDFHGAQALDLAERGVIVAPPQVARSSFVNRFENPYQVMMSGWGLLKNAKYRYGVDDVLPLSDHADFDELIELVERVQPKKVFTHHGYAAFAETLRARGIDATLARPDPQLRLF